MEDNTAYGAGYLFGKFVLVPLIIYGIGYGLIRIFRKRKPTKKEKIVLATVAIVLTLFVAFSSAARRVST